MKKTLVLALATMICCTAAAPNRSEKAEVRGQSETSGNGPADTARTEGNAPSASASDERSVQRPLSTIAVLSLVAAALGALVGASGGILLIVVGPSRSDARY